MVGPSLSLQRRDAHMVVGLSQVAQPCTFSHVCAVPSRNDWSIVGEDDVSLHLSVSSPVGCKPVWKRESCKVSLDEEGVGVGWEVLEAGPPSFTLPLWSWKTRLEKPQGSGGKLRQQHI